MTLILPDDVKPAAPTPEVKEKHPLAAVFETEKTPEGLSYLDENGETQQFVRAADVPSIVVYDSVERRILSHKNWERAPSLLEFKAELVNYIELYGDIYARNVEHLARTALQLQKKLNSKDNHFPIDMARGAAGRAANRIEEAMVRLGGWAPTKEARNYTTVIPYCLIALEKTGSEEVVSFRNCRPYVNGFVIDGYWA